MTTTQPRTPAGSPEGGQFTQASGAEGTLTLPHRTPLTHDFHAAVDERHLARVSTQAMLAEHREHVAHTAMIVRMLGVACPQLRTVSFHKDFPGDGLELAEVGCEHSAQDPEELEDWLAPHAPGVERDGVVERLLELSRHVRWHHTHQVVASAEMSSKSPQIVGVGGFEISKGSVDLDVAKFTEYHEKVRHESWDLLTITPVEVGECLEAARTLPHDNPLRRWAERAGAGGEPDAADAELRIPRWGFVDA